MGGRKRGLFVDEFVRPMRGARILDLGCGTAQILGFLPEDARYVGYDPSADYIAHAKRLHGDRGEFYVGYFGVEEAESLGPFDIVLACGVLHHLDDSEALQLSALVRQVLVSGGRFVTIDPTFSDDQNWLSRLLVSRDRGQNVRTGSSYEALVRSYFREVRGLLRHKYWIPYTHWIMECKA